MTKEMYSFNCLYLKISTPDFQQIPLDCNTSVPDNMDYALSLWYSIDMGWSNGFDHKYKDESLRGSLKSWLDYINQYYFLSSSKMIKLEKSRRH